MSDLNQRAILRICTGIHKQMRENMIKRTQRAILLFVIASLAVACGTAVTPVFDESDAVATKVVIVPTKRVISPTMTPQPPTAIPTNEPTVTPDLPTATPTDEPTPTQVPTQAPKGDADNGKVLFNEIVPMTGFSCAICHNVDVPAQIIGPSMLNIKETAKTRVAGQSVIEYLHTSIVKPDEYIVEGFVGGVMPQTWGDVYSESQIDDIIAYLLTLEG